MPGSTYSTNLKVELMATGENSGTWGDITNTNLGTALEQAIVGYGNPDYASDANLTISITNSNAAQAARALVLNVTSSLSLTATRELVVPTIQKQYIVQNNTTGSQSITVKTSAGTGITVPNGRKAHLYVNGTDVIQMFDFVDINGGAIDGTPIGASSASTGAFTTLNASGATTLDGNVTLGNASGDNVTVTGTITSNLLFTDNTYDIGASGATRPRNLFLAGAATIGGNLSVGGTLTLTGGLILNGNVTVGDSSADTLTVNATITSNLIFTDNTYDIGASGATRPRNLFLAGNATIGGNQTLTGSLTVDSTTDSSSTTTGSIQTDGGLGVAKALYVGTNVNIGGLTASKGVFTDANKNLTSSGTLLTDQGGTGLSSFTAGDLVYYATGTAFTKLGIGTNGQILTSTGTAPQWSTLSGVAVTTFSAGTTGLTPSSATSGAITLAGTLNVANGGTGLTSLASGRIPFGAGTSAFGNVANFNYDSANVRLGVGSTSPATTLSAGGATSTTLGLSISPDGWNAARHRLTVPISGDTSVWSFNWDGAGVDFSGYATSSISVGQAFIALSTGPANTAPIEKIRIDQSNVIINETGADYDFRVESDSYTHALFVDAGDNRIGLFNASPTGRVHLITDDVNRGLFIDPTNTITTNTYGASSVTNNLMTLRAPYNGSPEGNGNSGMLWGIRFTGNVAAAITEEGKSAGVYARSEDASAGYNRTVGLEFQTCAQDQAKSVTTRLTGFKTMLHYGAAVFNEDGLDYDFRVESDTSTHMLFVDASANRVGINASSPTETLDVDGSTRTRAWDFDNGTINTAPAFNSGLWAAYSILSPTSTITTASFNGKTVSVWRMANSNNSQWNYTRAIDYAENTDANFPSEQNYAVFEFWWKNNGGTNTDFTGFIAEGDFWGGAPSRTASAVSTGIVVDGWTLYRAVMQMASGKYLNYGFGFDYNRAGADSYFAFPKFFIAGGQRGAMQGGLPIFMSQSTGNMRLFGRFASVNQYGIGLGTDVVASSGTGITFPASQSASSNANTLDDYEEGTWTPTITTDGTAPSLSYLQQTGRYIKIGRLVKLSWYIQLNSVSSQGTGNLLIAGIPSFTADTNEESPGSFWSAGSIQGGVSAVWKVGCRVQNPNILILDTQNGNLLATGSLSGSAYLIGQIVYIATA